MTNDSQNNNLLTLIILLVAIAQCGLALYLPSLPAITYTFHTTSSYVQLTVFFYVMGISLSQWFYGPLSDYYGRKQITLWGLLLFIIGTVVALVSPKLSILLFARSVQGLGIGAVMTISRAILRDVFKGKTYIKNASKLASVFAISPVVFPVCGGYIQSYLGWRANFGFMLILSLITFVLWFHFFKESNLHQQQSKMSTLTILKNYIVIAKSSIFIKNTLCGGLIYAGEVIFLTMAPFLIQQHFHLTASFYGWLMLIAILGFILGSQASSFLANQCKHYCLILIGLSVCFLSSAIMWLEICFNFSNIPAILFPMSLFMFGAGFVYPNTSIGAVGHFPEKAGTASALLSSIQGGIATLSTALILFFHHNTFNMLVISFTIIILLSGLLGAGIFFEDRHNILD